MAKNTGKVRDKSGNFVSPEKWEPCVMHARIAHPLETYCKACWDTTCNACWNSTPPPPVDRMTDACKTLPCPSFVAGGKNCRDQGAKYVNSNSRDKQDMNCNGRNFCLTLAKIRKICIANFPNRRHSFTKAQA